MNGESDDILWELLLKAAVIENSLNEIKDYPSDEEINKLILPDRYELKMHRVIKKVKYKKRAISTLKIVRKAIAFASIILGISFAFLLQFEEVRASCHNTIIQIYEKYIQFDFHSDITSQGSAVNIEYVPDGFEEIYRTESLLKTSIEYQNQEGGIILLQYSTKKQALQIDNEHYKIKDVTFDEVNGKFFESIDEKSYNYMVWDINGTHYFIMSSLEEDEIIKIAKNLK